MAYALLQDIGDGKFYRPSPECIFKFVDGAYAMPEGHCMFDDPYSYGKIPVFNGVGRIPAADMPRVKEIIVGAMRRYWHARRIPHSWRDIYPEKTDGAALARSLARFMADNGLRF